MVKDVADYRRNLLYVSITFLMYSLEGSHNIILVVDGYDVGNISYLGLESPSAYLLGVVDGIEAVRSLSHLAYRISIQTVLFDSILEILIFSCRLGSKSIGLGIKLIPCLVACLGCLFKNCHSLLGDRRSLAGYKEHPFSVLVIHDERLVHIKARESHRIVQKQPHALLVGTVLINSRILGSQ